MEFAEEGGEGATPYEVLLHAAMVGQSTRFTRQDGVEETWRIMQPLLDAPPPVHAVRAGLVGAEAADELVAGHGRWHGALDRRHERGRAEAGRAERRRAVAVPADRRLRVPLQLPHRRARRPGRRDRLALRPALRLAERVRQPARPGGRLVPPRAVRDQPPDGAAYEPGTNVLATTWKTPTGWIVVRDALTMGPRGAEDEITPHTRPPADDDADHMLVRTVECLEGSVEVELVCEPVFDYGRVPASGRWSTASRHAADASGAGQTIRLQTDMALGIEGDRVRARHALEPGERALLRALLGRGPRVAADVDEAHARRHDRALLARLAGPGPHPRPPLARPDPALGARRSRA